MTSCPAMLVLVHQPKHALVDWAGRHLWIELDLAKRLLIIGDVLLQQPGQRLGLLGTEVDPLKVLHLDMRLAGL